MQDSYMTKIQGQAELQAGIYYEVDFSHPPIGEGGMGRVYEGVQVNQVTGIKRPVAIKFLYDGLPQSALDRAIREASIKIKCENLVEMISFVRAAQQTPDGSIVEHYHVVSELLEGVMLHDLINGKTTGTNGKTIAYAEELYKLYKENRDGFAVEIVKKVLSGLMYLHDAGYVHRDIDPSNIMVTADRKIKLIDFGVAHKMEARAEGPLLTHVGSFLGKGEFAAPELVLGDVLHQDATTDIYAVGILLFLLLTGKLPFTGSLQEVMLMQREQKMPVQEISNTQLRKIVDKATQKKQANRYQSAAEFRVALDDVKDATPRKTEAKTASEEPSVNATIILQQNEATLQSSTQSLTENQNRQSASIHATNSDNKTAPRESAAKKKKSTNTPQANLDNTNKHFAMLVMTMAAIGLACGALLSYVLM